jgi:gamma-glutamylcyclotransferase
LTVRYFAYCTLLAREEMRRFCPNAQPAGVGRITGYRVGFAGYTPDGSRGGCQLLPEPGHDVYGLVYELSDAEAAQLDEISGVGQGFYQRIDVTVELKADGNLIPAVTYVIPQPVADFRPSADYVRPILAGARALHLPAAYVAELEAAVAAAVAPS